MSIEVGLTELRDAVAALHRAPYLLTVSDDGRAHAVAVACEWQDDELAAGVGNRTLANARARPAVTLLWAPDDVDGYSLIVDGDVTRADGSGSGDNHVHIRPTRAVRHRPAA